jgi:hypothetical protein
MSSGVGSHDRSASDSLSGASETGLFPGGAFPDTQTTIVAESTVSNFARLDRYAARTRSRLAVRRAEWPRNEYKVLVWSRIAVQRKT